MSTYAFANERDKEHQRLKHFETLLDPGTIRHLETIGAASGWTCLEVGAGAGSITAWLCQAVGSNGHVTATDIDVSFLEPQSHPNLTILEHDITQDDLSENTFDLIHARAVLEHLKDPDLVLRKLIRSLKPGGWLLIEDNDHHLILNTDEPPSPFREAMKQAVKIISQTWSFDPFYGRKLYSELSALGIKELQCEGRVYQQPGGSSGAPQVWRHIIERLRQPILDSGALTTDQFEKALEALDNPEYGVMAPIYWAVWGNRGP